MNKNKNLSWQNIKFMCVIIQHINIFMSNGDDCIIIIRFFKK